MRIRATFFAVAVGVTWIGCVTDEKPPCADGRTDDPACIPATDSWSGDAIGEAEDRFEETGPGRR